MIIDYRQTVRQSPLKMDTRSVFRQFQMNPLEIRPFMRLAHPLLNSLPVVVTRITGSLCLRTRTFEAPGEGLSRILFHYFC